MWAERDGGRGGGRLDATLFMLLLLLLGLWLAGLLVARSSRLRTQSIPPTRPPTRRDRVDPGRPVLVVGGYCQELTR